MKTIKKPISMEKWMVEKIQFLSERERRSFSRQAEVLLETALKENGYTNPLLEEAKHGEMSEC